MVSLIDTDDLFTSSATSSSNINNTYHNNNQYNNYNNNNTFQNQNQFNNGFGDHNDLDYFHQQHQNQQQQQHQFNNNNQNNVHSYNNNSNQTTATTINSEESMGSNILNSYLESHPSNIKSMGDFVKDDQDSDSFNHIIMENDTLQGLSIRYNVKIEELRQLNKLSSNSIHERSVLIIPKKHDIHQQQSQQHKNEILNSQEIQETLKKRVISRFMKKTGCTDTQQAIHYLESANYDYYKSIHNYQRDSNVDIYEYQDLTSSPQSVPLGIISSPQEKPYSVSLASTHSSTNTHSVLKNSDSVINNFQQMYGISPKNRQQSATGTGSNKQCCFFF